MEEEGEARWDLRETERERESDQNDAKKSRRGRVTDPEVSRIAAEEQLSIDTTT